MHGCKWPINCTRTRSTRAIYLWLTKYDNREEVDQDQHRDHKEAEKEQEQHGGIVPLRDEVLNQPHVVHPKRHLRRAVGAGPTVVSPRVRADKIGHARINMYVNISHAWFKGTQSSAVFVDGHEPE